MAFVERRLAVLARRVGDVGEALAAREDRRLPRVAPQARRPPDALATDPVGAAVDRERLVADLQRTPTRGRAARTARGGPSSRLPPGSRGSTSPRGAGRRSSTAAPHRGCRSRLGSARGRPGRGTGRRSARRRRSCAPAPSMRIVQRPKGSTISNESGPAPRIRGRPSAPAGSCTAPGPSMLNTRPSANATLIWMSWVSHWSATASTPMRGMASSSPSFQIHAFTDSRISGLSGFVAHTSPSASSKPPLRSIATSYLRIQSLHARRVVGEAGAHLVEVEPEHVGVGVDVLLAVLGVVGPPSLHPRLELGRHRFAQPVVEPAHLTDRVGLHGAEVDVEEAVGRARRRGTPAAVPSPSPTGRR